jgi:arylsulfatase A
MIAKRAATVLPLLTCLVTFAATVPAKAAPNIVLVLCDDLGLEVLRHRGGESYETPEFDRLAAEGVRFDTCLATPMCATSRAMLLTGRYNFRNYTRWAHLDPDQPTIASLLRGHGYRTCLVGKWHLGNWQPDGQGLRGPARMGFDRYLSAVLDPPGDSLPQGNVYWRGMLVEDGQERRLPDGRFVEDEHLDFIRGYLRDADHRPFFLHYAPYLVHRPLVRVAEPVAGQDDRRHGQQENFAAMVRRLDAAIGRLRDELARAGVADNTLLVVTSDNGTDNVAEAKDLRSRWRGREVAGGKYRVDELGTTVPCMVSWPGRSGSGTIVTSPIDFTDVLPTLLDAAGASPPEGIDGVSFLPLIRGEPHASPRRFAFSWGRLDGSNRVYHEPQARRGAILHAARDSRWRYLSDGRLFDAVADPLMLDPIRPGASADADEARAAMRLAVERLVASHPRLW